MRLVLNSTASVVVSIVATWLVRHLVLSAERGAEGGTPGDRSGVVVVIVPVMAGNHWHINQPMQSHGRLPGFGKCGGKAARQHSRGGKL